MKLTNNEKETLQLIKSLFFKMRAIKNMKGLTFSNDIEELNFEWAVIEDNVEFFNMNKGGFLSYIYSNYGIFHVVKFIVQK